MLMPRAQHVTTQAASWASSTEGRSSFRPAGFGSRPGDAVGKAVAGTGFLVPFRVASSSRGGLGVFAAMAIPKDACVWSHEVGNVTAYTESETLTLLKMFGRVQGADWLRRTFVWRDCLVKPMDDSRFLNSSASEANVRVAEKGCLGDAFSHWRGGLAGPENSPSSGSTGPSSYALRDIAPGEELLEDSEALVSPPWFRKLVEEYEVSPRMCPL